NALRRTRRCSASASAYDWAPSSCRSFVDLSTSVKRNVTVPAGSSRMLRSILAERFSDGFVELPSPPRSKADFEIAVGQLPEARLARVAVPLPAAERR